MTSPVPLDAQPLVSVLIRSMDRPSLDNALASVAAQTWGNIEVVVVNAKGVGHRALPSLCGRFPLRFIDSATPRPRSEAANVALDSAAGAFLLFLDDDDLLDAGHISTLAQALSAASPDIPVAYTGIRCTDEEGQVLEQTYATPFSRIQLFAGNYIPIHAALFRQTVLSQGVRIDTALAVYEDWDFWLQIAQLGDFVFVDGISATYCISSAAGFGVNYDERAKQAAAALIRRWLPRCADADLLAIMASVGGEVQHQAELTALQARTHAQLLEADAQLVTADQQLRQCMAELQIIRQSNAWKFIQKLRKIRDAF